MFESLSEKLSGIFDKLTGRGALSEEDVNAAMREVRRALLEADVALEVVRSFIDRTRTKAIGAAVVKSIKPGQMVVKIVHDSLVETLGRESQAIDLNAAAPVAIMLGISAVHGSWLLTSANRRMPAAISSRDPPSSRRGGTRPSRAPAAAAVTKRVRVRGRNRSPVTRGLNPRTFWT